jgi:hypothetical protein
MRRLLIAAATAFTPISLLGAGTANAWCFYVWCEPNIPGIPGHGGIPGLGGL